MGERTEIFECDVCLASGPFTLNGHTCDIQWMTDEIPAQRARIKELEASPNKELEHCCKMLIGAGISTGHAGTITELVEELILNVVEALKSPWMPVSERLPEDDHREYLVRCETTDSSLMHTLAYFFDGRFTAGPVTHWQPISEIPK